MENRKENKLTLEERTEILKNGCFPLSKNATIKYTPEVFENNGVPEDLRPVYHLRAWTARERDQYSNIIRQSMVPVMEKILTIPAEKRDELTINIKRAESETETEFEERKNQYLIALYSSIASEKDSTDSKLLPLVTACIVNWENKVDQDGNQIELNRDDIEDYIVRSEIAYLLRKIISISCLNAREVQSLK